MSDGRIDRQTDRQTDGIAIAYAVACRALKTQNRILENNNKIISIPDSYHEMRPAVSFYVALPSLSSVIVKRRYVIPRPSDLKITRTVEHPREN